MVESLPPLQQRVVDLEADLREERRSRVKLERFLKNEQAERGRLEDELKLEKNAHEKILAEASRSSLEGNKLRFTIDQLNKKLDGAAAELGRLRSELKLRDQLISDSRQPHPPNHVRKEKTRSAPSHERGNELRAGDQETTGPLDLQEQVEAALRDKDKAEKQVAKEKKRCNTLKRVMAELLHGIGPVINSQEWVQHWMQQSIAAVDGWLAGIRVKDNTSSVWSQGVASTRSALQYMLLVTATAKEDVKKLQAASDNACRALGQNLDTPKARAHTEEELSHVRLKAVQDSKSGSLEKMRGLIHEAQVIKGVNINGKPSSNEAEAEPNGRVPPLRLQKEAASVTPPDDPPSSRRSQPQPPEGRQGPRSGRNARHSGDPPGERKSHESKEGKEGKEIKESKESKESRGKSQDTKDSKNERLDGPVREGRERPDAPGKPNSQLPAVANGQGGGYAQQYRKRVQMQQQRQPAG